MRSDCYRLFARAIENHAPLACRYKGMPREFCPITLGHDAKGEVTHVWLTGGAASGPLPAWRTFRLEHVTGARPREGEWQSGQSKGDRPPSFEVDYDANRASSYAPRHSLGDCTAYRRHSSPSAATRCAQRRCSRPARDRTG